MIYTYTSKLKKDEFFERLKGFRLENILTVNDSPGTKKEGTPTGFVIEGVWLSIYIGPRESVWVGLGKTGDHTIMKEELIHVLRLEASESYPYVLDSPEKEIMKLWNFSINNNPSKGYLDFYKTPEGERILKEEVDYLKKELEGCNVSLDVGCGPGIFERELSDKEIIGVDSSEDMLQLARWEARTHFVLAGAEELPFKEGIFDCVFFVTSLEFINDYKKAIEEAIRVLKKGGKIITLLLNPESGYFDKKMKEGGYLSKKIKKDNINAAERYLSEYFDITKEYLLNVDGNQNPKDSMIYALKGVKK
jgi:SAM-dependent methyltransferase